MANKRTTKNAKATTKKAASTSSTRSVRKAPVKSSQTKTVKKESPIQVESPVRQQTSKPAMRFKKSYVIIALIVFLIAGLLYGLRSYLVAATVNGQPISRFEVIAELEKQSGKQTLDSLITKKLILQEAKKQNVQISDQQVDDEIKKIEGNVKQQGRDLDQMLAMQGLTRDSLRDQVRVQKIVETILGRQIVITDKDVTDYIASNSASLPQDMPEATLKDQVKQQLKQQKLSELFQTWLQNLRQGAKVTYLVNY